MVGTHAFPVDGQRTLEMGGGIGRPTLRTCRLGEFAVVMRFLQRHLFTRKAFELVGNVETRDPVAFLLIDHQQIAQRRPHMQASLFQFAEQILGTVEQSGTHIILTEFE